MTPIFSNEQFSPLPIRHSLCHQKPNWVPDNAIYFITMCTARRRTNILCHNKLAEIIWDSAIHRQSLGQWWIYLLLLMPDHLHALITFAPDSCQRTVISSWKRYITRHAGVTWQTNFFEHRLRNVHSLEEKAAYIRQNPVRAGLVKNDKEWPFVWGPQGHAHD